MMCDDGRILEIELLQRSNNDSQLILSDGIEASNHLREAGRVGVNSRQTGNEHTYNFAGISLALFSFLQFSFGCLLAIVLRIDSNANTRMFLRVSARSE